MTRPGWRGAVAALVGLVAATAASADDRPTIGELVDEEPPRLAGQLFTPSGASHPLDRAASVPPPRDGVPVKAAVYVPECASPSVPPDHVTHLQTLGLAVAVPSLGGDRCVLPTERLGTLHREIKGVADDLAALDWVDGDALFLIGHGVGADVVSTFTAEGVFRGMVGFAAACPFGIQNVTPMVTFRALDDPVLRNRGTRCSQFAARNVVHLEFAGSEHALRLGPGAPEAGGGRELMRRALAAFLGVGEVAGGGGLSEEDALDLRQLGGG